MQAYAKFDPAVVEPAALTAPVEDKNAIVPTAPAVVTSAMVPLVVIVPPDKPVPAVMDVTVSAPAAAQVLSPRKKLLALGVPVALRLDNPIVLEAIFDPTISPDEFRRLERYAAILIGSPLPIEGIVHPKDIPCHHQDNLLEHTISMYRHPTASYQTA